MYSHNNVHNITVIFLVQFEQSKQQQHKPESIAFDFDLFLSGRWYHNPALWIKCCVTPQLIEQKIKKQIWKQLQLYLITNNNKLHKKNNTADIYIAVIRNELKSDIYTITK